MDKNQSIDALTNPISHHRRTAFNAVSTAISHGGSSVLLLALTPLILRTLGLEIYGVWALVNTALLYTSVADFGIGAAITKYTAEYQARGESEPIRALATFGVIFYAVIALVIVPSVFFFTPTIISMIKVSVTAEPSAALLLHFFSGYLGIALMATVFNALLIGLGRASISSMATASGQIIFVCLAAVLLLLGFGVTALIVAATLGFTLRLVLTYQAVRRHLGTSLFMNPLRLERSLIRRLFTVGGWVQISSLCTLALYESDQLFVGLFVNAAAIGIFDIGSKLARTVRVMSYYFSIAAMPTISAMEVEFGTRRAEMSFLSGVRYVGLASFATIGLLIGISPMVLALWLGPHFIHAQTVIMIISVLGVSYIIDNLAAVGTTILRGLGATRLEALYTSVGAAVNIAASFFLGSRYGINGIIGATVLGAIVGASVFFAKFSRVHNMHLPQTLLRPVLALALPAALGIIAVVSLHAYVPHGWQTHVATLLIELVLAVALYTVIFLGTLRQTRFFGPQDLRMLRAILPTKIVNVLRTPRLRALLLRG